MTESLTAFERFEKARWELFDAIDRSIAEDPHHKSYEGAFEIYFPNRFDKVYQIDLHCYVIGPSRHYQWHGESLMEAVEWMEKDVKTWIKEQR